MQYKSLKNNILLVVTFDLVNTPTTVAAMAAASNRAISGIRNTHMREH
jgi:hypothetical protein